MIGYFVRRLVALVPVALGVATLTFALIHLVPGDPVVAMLGDTAGPADIAGMRHELGLDRPIAAQYAGFLWGLAHGDLGESISMKEPVARLIAARFPATLELAGAGLLVAIVIAFPLGLIAGANPGGAADMGAMSFAILGISVPHLCLGPLMMIVFSLDLGWFPLTGRGGLAHLVLPAVTLGTALAAILARMLRQSLVQVREADYIRTARSKGLSAFAALMRHGLRNALTPVITLLGLETGALLTGAIVTEMIFSWPGMGRLLIAAISARDYPLVEGCVLTFALSYVVVNMATDLVYGIVDPRIRLICDEDSQAGAFTLRGMNDGAAQSIASSGRRDRCDARDGGRARAAPGARRSARDRSHAGACAAGPRPLARMRRARARHAGARAVGSAALADGLDHGGAALARRGQRRRRCRGAGGRARRLDRDARWSMSCWRFPGFCSRSRWPRFLARAWSIW